MADESPTIREGGYTAVLLIDVGSLSSGCVCVAPAGPAARRLAKRASGVSGATETSPEFLLAARLACLLLLILRLLGGAGERGAADEPRVAMADTLFSLFVCLGTCLGYERTELLGWGTLESETLELCKESLGMGARALLGIVTLEFTLESLRGTGSVDSKRRDKDGAGSLIQFRRLSWKGAVTIFIFK